MMWITPLSTRTSVETSLAVATIEPSADEVMNVPDELVEKAKGCPAADVRLTEGDKLDE